MTIKQLLKSMSRAEFVRRMRAKGWSPSDATVSRWVAGLRTPSPAAAAMITEVVVEAENERGTGR